MLGGGGLASRGPGPSGQCVKIHMLKYAHDQPPMMRGLALALLLSPANAFSFSRRCYVRQTPQLFLGAAESELTSLTVTTLKEKCRELGLKVGGNKAELIARISDASGEGENASILSSTAGKQLP